MDSYGIFTKDGETRGASSQREAVGLRFNGWQEVDSAPVPAQELRGSDLDDALESEGLPKSGSADEKRDRLAKARSAKKS